MWIDTANSTGDIYVGLIVTTEYVAGGSLIQNGQNVLVWAKMFEWMQWSAWVFQ